MKLKPFKTTSFHYRYYCWVRRMWGCGGEPPASLCPYFHTMFWGSIFCVLFAPGIVAGWIFMKLGRILCKMQNPVTDKVIEVLKEKTRWIERLDKGPTDFSESPVATGLLFTVFGVSVIVCAAMAVYATGLILWLLGYGAWNIANIAVTVFDFVTWTLAQIFMIFYWFGFVFHSIYSGVVWLFTNGPLWYTIGSWVVWMLAWIAGIGLASLALCVLFIGISKLSFARRFGKILTNKFNGYGEAQRVRKIRRTEAIKKMPPWKCESCKYNNNPASKKWCRECGKAKPMPTPAWAYAFMPLYPFGWAVVMVITIGDKFICRIKTRDFIGPFGIIWAYIVAVKKGVCPIIEFVDPVQQLADAQASARERMVIEAAEAENAEAAEEAAWQAREIDVCDDTAFGAGLLDDNDKTDGKTEEDK